MSTPLLLRFVSEARELLQSAASGLLDLEKNPGDEAAINDVFRSVHTLKGSVGLFDFPAFAKLVHAGEDVLSAVRSGTLGLNSDIVDLLLDALDRVGAWIDDIEGSGQLAAGSDGVSRDMTAALRALLPKETETAAQEPSPQMADLADVSWLDHISEADRMAAVLALFQGRSVLALEYRPLEDCFFSGEDPLALFRRMDDVLGLLVEPTEAWPDLLSLDPYRCVLRFRALTCLAREQLEDQFRYVIEQVSITELAAHHLVFATGTGGVGPVYEDFVDQAQQMIAAEDWDALRCGIAALAELTGQELLAASALRWMVFLLDTGQPRKDWLMALTTTLAQGERCPIPEASCSDAPLVAETQEAASSAVTAPAFDHAAPVHGPRARLTQVARDILDGQRVILELPVDPAGFLSRVTAVSRTVGNILHGIVRHGDLDLWQNAVQKAEEQGHAGAMLECLNAVLDDPPTVDDTALLTKQSAPLAVQMADAGSVSSSNIAADGAVIGAGAEHRQPVARVLKVDQAKIDALMTLIGELVVSKNSLPFLARRAEDVHGSREMAREIKDLYGVIDRLAQEMQAAIMAVRMLPVSEVFDRFPRLVRDVARKLGKKVELVIEGEDTAADKNIIEVLGDPLLHIIRNSLDHGIESPEERLEHGKSAVSTLLIKAFQESDQVVIEVRDDGRGINPVKIRAAAVAKGLLDEDRAARLSDQEAVNLVFAAGFSTAAQVSDLSGRGVGMDVVVTTIEKSGGSVSLTSEMGQGTCVRLSLPLSMAVTRVMMVEAAGGMLFGIPMDHIAETVRISRSQVRHIKQAETFVLRDTIVPLLRLDTLLGMPPSLWFGDEDQEDAVLVVRVGGGLTGLVVDHFREGMDIILKPFDGILSGIAGYAGTALLGDGRVLLVLNLKELL